MWAHVGSGQFGISPAKHAAQSNHRSIHAFGLLLVVPATCTRTGRNHKHLCHKQDEPGEKPSRLSWTVRVDTNFPDKQDVVFLHESSQFNHPTQAAQKPYHENYLNSKKRIDWKLCEGLTLVLLVCLAAKPK